MFFFTYFVIISYKSEFGSRNLIQLKIDLSGKNAALAAAKVKEIEAKKDLEKVVADRGKAESAVLGGSNGVLLSVGTFSSAGRSSALDGVKNPVEKPATPPGSLKTPGSSGTP